jgi:hypothetical protein
MQWFRPRIGDAVWGARADNDTIANVYFERFEAKRHGALTLGDVIDLFSQVMPMQDGCLS